MVLRPEFPAQTIWGLSFTRLGIEHLAELRELHVAAFRVGACAIYDDQQRDAYEAFLRSPARLGGLFARNVQLALVDRRVVGSAGWTSPVSGRDARLTDHFVAPLFRRLGLGRAMIERAEAAACRAGFRAISTHVRADEMAFYMRAGYAIAAHGTLFAGATEIRVVHMRKSLGEEAEPPAPHPGSQIHPDRKATDRARITPQPAGVKSAAVR